jgi:hypothetical protein
LTTHTGILEYYLSDGRSLVAAFNGDRAIISRTGSRSPQDCTTYNFLVVDSVTGPVFAIGTETSDLDAPTCTSMGQMWEMVQARRPGPGGSAVRPYPRENPFIYRPMRSLAEYLDSPSTGTETDAKLIYYLLGIER